MSNTITKETKKTIWEFMVAQVKNEKLESIKDLNKSKVAAKFGVSPRTIGRIIDAFSGSEVTEPDEVEVDKNAPVTAKTLEKLKESPNVTVINWTITQNSVLLTLSDGNNASITKDNPNFKKVCDLLMGGNLSVLDLVNPAKNIKYKYGNLEVDEDGVLFEGKKLPKEIAFFVLDAVRAGNKNDVERFAKFLNNLLENPSYRAVQTLYPFIKHNDITITDDGMILAWKRITHDFKDVYTKTIDNSVGSIVKVRRNEVEEDSNKTCAKGLHLCAKHYLKSYSGEVVVQCLLHPRDVVAVPLDYNGSKLRCCEYKVIRDVTKEWLNNSL